MSTTTYNNAYGGSRVRSQSVWTRFVHAMTVSLPFIAFLLYMRATGENRYVSFTLPVVGEFPNGVLSDLTLLVAFIALWSLVAQWTWARRLYVVALVLIGLFVLAFRAIDHYYYYSTKSSFNAYVLYTNMAMVQEGGAIVLSAPGGLLAALAVALHYVVYLASSAYRRLLYRLSSSLTRQYRLVTAAALAGVALLLLANAYALRIHPRRKYAMMSLSGEYQLLAGLPRFIREQRRTAHATAVKPARLYLPDPNATASAPASTIARPAHRPDIFVITVESFNALYALPAKELHPGLTDDVMPYFRSLISDGYEFPHAYTSDAYTFNGIISVLCSQYTMSEVVWGPGCLPQVLRQNGYEPFTFIAINQLRPYRYDNFHTMGFDLSHVFDAVRVRQGKKNIYFDFLTDKELFDAGAYLADSIAHAPNRKPLFVHMSTDQMHVPGMFRATTCAPYPFPPGIAVDAMTKSMINSAHCTDRDISQLVTHLKQSGLYDDAIVIITADHAFNLSLWDRRESELARIPLFIKFPKSAPQPRIDTAQVIGQIDIAPTILDYLGLHSGRAMYGRSMLEKADLNRSVAGISTSRLLSLATRSGVVFHSRGQPDYSETMVRHFSLGDAGTVVTDRTVQDQLDALFDTVLYFDSHPSEFAQAVAGASRHTTYSTARRR